MKLIWMSMFATALVLALSLREVSSYNILIVAPFGSSSHRTIFELIAQGLVQKGHQVTLLSGFKLSTQQKGLTHVWVSEAYEILFVKSNFSFFDGSMNDPDVMNTVVNMVFQVRNVTYERPEVQALLKKSSKNSGPRYDLLVVDCIFNEFLLPLAHHLGIPSVYISPSMLFPPIAWNLNIPRPAYLSSSLSSGDKGTSLISRGLNAFGNLMFLTMRNRNILSKHDEYIKNILPGTPPLIELERNVSFVMTHTHPSLYPSSPSMPYTADIACILCRPAKALPKDLEEFFQSSGDHGVIFFSLGSVTKGLQMPMEMKTKIIEAFARLPQKFLWKFEREIEGLPANIRLISWAPQQDLLGHPKLKLFITHCGGGSIWEASYHGVPVIGFPLSADQYENAAHVQEAGIGESLDWKTFTVDSLVDKIQLLLNNNKYKANVQRVSSLLKDQSVAPLDKVVFWLEYVIRHKGAPHLKSAAEHLNFFQYFLVDVLGFVALVFAIILGLIYFVVRMCLRLVCQKIPKLQKVKKN